MVKRPTQSVCDHTSNEAHGVVSWLMKLTSYVLFDLWSWIPASLRIYLISQGLILHWSTCTYKWGHAQNVWAVAWDFQQCGMRDQLTLRPAGAYTRSLIRAMNILWLLLWIHRSVIAISHVPWWPYFLTEQRGTCIKGLFWPPLEPKTESYFSPISSSWFVRIAQV